MKWHHSWNYSDLSNSLADTLTHTEDDKMVHFWTFQLPPPHLALSESPERERRGGGVALLVKGSLLQQQQGGRMLPLFLSVPCSWLMLAAFYLLVYRHSARLSSVAGSCTNLRCAAGRWEQLSWDWRHLHPLSTQQNTEQIERKSFVVRSTEALKETDNMATGGSQILICVSVCSYTWVLSSFWLVAQHATLKCFKSKKNNQ